MQKQDAWFVLNGLFKRFGERTVLYPWDLQVTQGCCLGLLGPNGAGKTTLTRLISGTLPADGGTISLAGFSLPRDLRARKLMGFVPQDLALYEDLSALENLQFWGGLYGLRGRSLRLRAREVLEQVGLSERTHDPVRTFSGGMKRRLNLAAGIIHKPQLLLLDEPTVGIDVQAKVHILELVQTLHREGTTIIFTSHQLEEVERLCDRIVILDGGRLLADGTLAELTSLVGEQDLLTIQGAFPARADLTADLGPEVNLLGRGEGELSLGIPSSSLIPAIVQSLQGKGSVLTDLSIQKPGLETVFLKLTGKTLRDG